MPLHRFLWTPPQRAQPVTGPAHPRNALAMMQHASNCPRDKRLQSLQCPPVKDETEKLQCPTITRCIWHLRDILTSGQDGAWACWLEGSYRDGSSMPTDCLLACLLHPAFCVSPLPFGHTRSPVYGLQGALQAVLARVAPPRVLLAPAQLMIKAMQGRSSFSSGAACRLRGEV